MRINSFRGLDKWINHYVCQNHSTILQLQWTMWANITVLAFFSHKNIVIMGNRILYIVSLFELKRCTPIEQMRYSYMEKIESNFKSDVILLAPEVF